MLRFKTYQAVRQVLAAGSETAAAKRLGVTPQAISRHIRTATREIPLLPFCLDIVRRLCQEHADFLPNRAEERMDAFAGGQVAEQGDNRKPQAALS